MAEHHVLDGSRPAAHSRARRHRLGGGLAVVALVALAGCSGGQPVEPGSAAAATPAHTAADPGSHTPHSPAPAAGSTNAAGAAASAVELRSQLQVLLGEHVRLTVLLMRDRIAGAGERTRATFDAVQRNTDELTGAMRTLFGESAAAPFGQLWTSHVRQLQDYAGGLADQDEAAKEQARDRLVVTERDVARLLSTAAGGALSREAAETAVRMHVNTLLRQADAYAAGDHARAYAVARESFAHMLMTADALATAMATAKGMPVDELEAPRRRLQSALSRLFAEHMGLTVEAMRAATDGAPEFSAAGASLNANSAELADAVGALYGDSARRQFVDLWAGHVQALVDYASATARDDAGARDGARQFLDQYATQLATFLATATGQQIPAIQLTGAITQHDRDLTEQIDAYAGGEFARAQEVSAAAYRHMFELSQTLAEAIGNEVASALPRGGAQTGAGGTARAH